MGRLIPGWEVEGLLSTNPAPFPREAVRSARSSNSEATGQSDERRLSLTHTPLARASVFRRMRLRAMATKSAGLQGRHSEQSRPRRSSCAVACRPQASH